MANFTSKWARNEVASSVTPVTFDGFKRGFTPGFRVEGFLSTKEANQIAERVEKFVEEYDTAPGVGRVGATMVEHGHDFDEYTALSSMWLDKSMPERDYLVNYTCGFLALNTGYTIKPLTKEGKAAYYGLFRKINTGAGPHLDILSEDSLAFASRPTGFQASLVLHLQVPYEGGETVIWDRTAQDGDMAYQYDGWQYREELFAGHAAAEVPCVAGDLVILSTMNYHKVNPCISADANRISFSLFLMIFEDEPGVIYIYN